MRDPDATIRFESNRVVRTLREPLGQHHFLRSTLARQWAERGSIVRFEETGVREVGSPRLPFLTYPNEWCDAQLFAAARHTLELQKEAVDAGFDLKDASAWNVLFNGTRPLFCDLLSFVPLSSRRWWALAQYARHFLFPLLISRYRGIHGHLAFQAWRDGMPPDVASAAMGTRRFLTRFWPLMAGARRNIGSADFRASAASDTGDAAAVKRFRESLHASLEWWLAGLAPRARPNRRGSWGAYRNERGHYKDEAVSSKRTWIAQWLADLKPEWVADLGCNSGEFSFMAAEAGASVVAVDSDHDSVEAMFRVAGATGRLYPVLASLDDLNGARGWGGTEFRGLSERMAGSFDLVMMLALIHHLAVAASVPLDAIAAFARACTRRWLIIEFIDPKDPQMQLLCTRHQRNAEEFSVARQRDAFLRAGFVLQAQVQLDNDTRVLSLLELRA